MQNLIERSDTVIYIPGHAYIYELRKEIKDAEECRSIYDLRSCWLKEPSKAEQEPHRGYLRIIEQRLAEGTLQFEWLVTIENKKKFECLIDHLKSILNNKPEIIMKNLRNYLRVLILPKNGYLRLLNLQITYRNKEKILIIGTPNREGDFIIGGFKIKNQTIIDELNDYFSSLWNRAILVVGQGQIYFDELKNIGNSVCDEEEFVENKVEELKNLYYEKESVKNE